MFAIWYSGCAMVGDFEIFWWKQLPATTDNAEESEH